MLPLWWRKHFIRVELLLALAIAIVFGIWGRYFDGISTINATVGGDRKELYGALAAIFGALLGFVITAVSIVLGYANSDKLSIVRESSFYDDLWNCFKVATRALSLATVTSLSGLIFDRGTTVNDLIVYINIFAIALAVLRVWRVVWVLENVIAIITKER